MKKLLNTLYVNTQNTYLHQERDTIVIKLGDQKLAQFPVLTITSIVCFGVVSVSPFLMAHCAKSGIDISFHTDYGKFLAQVQGEQSGNVLLRRQQYRWADDAEKSTTMARLFVAAKISNARAVLQRELRNHGDNAEAVAMKAAIEHLAGSVRRLEKADSVDSVRGIEGEAAARYFGVFSGLLRATGLVFDGRVRRPPTDPVNALLSFAYSLLSQECASALYAVGLDPYVGFLHRDRPGRKSLALDLMEEFRAAWADRFVLTLINRKQIQLSDFITEASGAVRLKDDSRKAVLTAYQVRKQEEIKHPYLEETVPIGLLPHCQAMLMARHLRGDLAFYPPFLLK
jgi:CRISP-associated protein Cas1